MENRSGRMVWFDVGFYTQAEMVEAVSADPSSIGEDVGERTFYSKLTIALKTSVRINLPV